MDSILQFVIVCPLVFLAGLVDAVAGGGGLISLPAYLIAGLPVHTAIGTNKLSSAMGATLATVRYARMGFIKLKLALISAACALAGSTLGAEIALLIEEGTFRIIMLVVLPLTALYTLRTHTLESDGSLLRTEGKTILICMAISLVIGVYDGFYGPGTGTFMLLLFTGVAHLSLNESAGLTKVANLSTNIAALTVYIINGKVIFPLGLAAGVFSLAGNYIGTRLFARGGAKFVKPVIIAVLSIFFVKVLLEVVGVSLF